MSSYNGWSNYETWAVKLWMDNEEGSYNYWQEQAEEIFKREDYDKDSAAYTLAKSLQSEHEEALPELQGFASDLLNAAMGEVDWREIAVSMLDDYESEHEEEIKEARAEAI